MAYDDDEPEPEPRDRPRGARARRAERIRELYEVRRKVLRWVYAGLGVLAIIVIVLAMTR